MIDRLRPNIVVEAEPRLTAGNFVLGILNAADEVDPGVHIYGLNDRSISSAFEIAYDSLGQLMKTGKILPIKRLFTIKTSGRFPSETVTQAMSELWGLGYLTTDKTYDQSRVAFNRKPYDSPEEFHDANEKGIILRFTICRDLAEEFLEERTKVAALQR